MSKRASEFLDTISIKKITQLKRGKSYLERISNLQIRKNFKKIPFSNFENINLCDILIICVPTPLKKNKSPNLEFIKNTFKTIKSKLRKNQLLYWRALVTWYN